MEVMEVSVIMTVTEVLEVIGIQDMAHIISDLLLGVLMVEDMDFQVKAAFLPAMEILFLQVTEIAFLPVTIADHSLATEVAFFLLALDLLDLAEGMVGTIVVTEMNMVMEDLVNMELVIKELKDWHMYVIIRQYSNIS